MIQAESQVASPLPDRHWYQQRTRLLLAFAFLAVLGLLMVMFLAGYEIDSLSGRAAYRKEIVKYFLINVDGEEPSNVEILLIDDARTVDYISRWIEHRIDPTKLGAKGLMPIWEDALLGYDKDSRHISYDDPPLVGLADHAVLKELFRKHGRSVDSVPGKKPPDKSKRDGGRIPVENE